MAHLPNIQSVLRISTDLGAIERCKSCDRIFNVPDFAEIVNHYIKDHGFVLLHVGEETAEDLEADTGKHHFTVAVLGLGETPGNSA